MPRTKLFNKRVFKGNQFSKTVKVGVNSAKQNRPKAVNQKSNVVTEKAKIIPGSMRYTPEHNRSASTTKVFSPGVFGGESLDRKERQYSGNQIINIVLLSNAILESSLCKFCKSECSLSICEKVNGRKGLSSVLSIVCNNCMKETDFKTSPQVGNTNEINIRCVYGLKTIGKGLSAGRVLCAILDLPGPPKKFERYNNIIGKSIEAVAKASMISATEEAVQMNSECNELTPESPSTDISVALDGTWQKRGHTSLNGVVSVTSIDTSKVLDVEILTKFCHRCNLPNDNNENHLNCSINFKGSSGGMEVSGAVSLFSRSEASRGVRYKNYLGDGDSKGFLRVVDSKPYGESLEIKKLECVGHVQKRMGGRLRRLRKELKGVRLSDGKPIGGKKGRLTDSEIDTLQNYYGQAIRRNPNNLEKMKQDVWATFFHKVSTDDNPQHGLCDISWCKFKKAESEGRIYKHKNSIIPVVTEKIKPIFRDLAHPELLRKCLHGRTQNANESFNSVIWTRIPKITFVGYETLKCGVFDAVLAFNEGSIGRYKVLKELGIEPGINCVHILRELDIERLRGLEKSFTVLSKTARQKHRSVKRKLEDAENTEEPEYATGMY